jgi:hypothetical protein
MKLGIKVNADVYTNWLYRIILALSVILTASNNSPAQNALNWPMSYRAELVSQVIEIGNSVSYVAPSPDAGGHVTYRLARTKSFFTEMTNGERQKYAMDLYKIIFSYVLGDSARYFSDISLDYYQIDDPSVHILYTHGPQLRDSLPISDRCLEDRFILLSTIVPIKSLAVSTPGARYKRKVMGFSLPTYVEARKYKWDDVSMRNYATVLASVMYDYVLRRDDGAVSKLVFQFSDEYNNLKVRPVAESVYPMNCDFIQDIKRRNVMMFYHPDPSADRAVLPTDIETRLAEISFLAQGRLKYWYSTPVGSQKGRLIFDCYYRGARSDYLYGNSPDVLLQCLGNIIIDYCFRDSAVNFDSITVRLFDNQALLISGSKFAVRQLPFNTTEDDRMGLLLNILPFVAKVHFGDDEFEVSLQEIPDCSPIENMGTYVTLLGHATYEYVFHRQRKSATISLIDRKERGKSYFPTIQHYNTAIRYLYAAVPQRRI